MTKLEKEKRRWFIGLPFGDRRVASRRVEAWKRCLYFDRTERAHIWQLQASSRKTKLEKKKKVILFTLRDCLLQHTYSNKTLPLKPLKTVIDCRLSVQMPKTLGDISYSNHHKMVENRFLNFCTRVCLWIPKKTGWVITPIKHVQHHKSLKECSQFT